MILFTQLPPLSPVTASQEWLTPLIPHRSWSPHAAWERSIDIWYSINRDVVFGCFVVIGDR
jgi:hypothetical protein